MAFTWLFFFKFLIFFLNLAEFSTFTLIEMQHLEIFPSYVKKKSIKWIYSFQILNNFERWNFVTVSRYDFHLNFTCLRFSDPVIKKSNEKVNKFTYRKGKKKKENFTSKKDFFNSLYTVLCGDKIIIICFFPAKIC